MTGPAVCRSRLDFIAGGLVGLLGGLACAVVLFGYAWWAPLVARRRLARHPLAAAGERRLARPQHRRGALGPAGRRLRLPARGRRAGGQGGPAVRAGRLGAATGSSPADGGCISCSTRRPGCASGRCCSCLVLVLAANGLVFWALAGALTPGIAGLGAAGGVRPGGDRHLVDRVRRAQLGARRSRRAGGRGRAARPGHRPRPARWPPPRRPGPAAGLPARRAPLAGCHLRLPRLRLARCWSGST